MKTKKQVTTSDSGLPFFQDLDKNVISMKTQVEAWLNLAKEAVEKNSKAKWPETPFNHETLRWTFGKRYAKVFVDHPNGGRGSAFCFIDINEGDIYKPSGTKAPAPGIRGNIVTINPKGLDGSTGWLYRR